MKSYLKVLTNIFLASISLSVLLGSFLRIVGPINLSNQINRKINIVGKSRRSFEKTPENNKSGLNSFNFNKLDKLKRLEKLINKWESIIIK